MQYAQTRFAFYNQKSHQLRVGVQDPRGCVIQIATPLGLWIEAYIRAAGLPASVEAVIRFVAEVQDDQTQIQA